MSLLGQMGGLGAVLGLSLALGAGCASEPLTDEAVTELPTVVPLGKEDNFFSETAQEYEVRGTAQVTLDASDLLLSEEEQLAKARRLVPFKQIVIGWFLNSWIVSKSSHSTNQEYGGFHAITKNGSYEEMDLQRISDGVFQFAFRQELSGPFDLLGAMPVEYDTDGQASTDLMIGRISNHEMQQLETNHEWYRKAPWSDFDPSKVDSSKLEAVHLEIAPEPRSLDAWPDYGRLFANGKVAIGIHYGWDYHSEYHLKHSREIYEWLVGKGFSSPVADYEHLKHDSGPLTRTIEANGKPLVVEISLFWGKPNTDTDPDTAAGGKQLEADMVESLQTRDVIIFSGHSGPFYGFALANWRKTDEGDLDDSKIAGLDLPYNHYQIVLAEGCETYALGQAFWDNPAKADRKHLDILTTNSFSNASTSAAVMDFLNAIVGTGYSGDVHIPKTYGKLLKDLDSNSYWFQTMYGVHGIDDNPHLHPYAVASDFCATCSNDTDCQGANVCVKLDDGAYCTGPCTGDDGCGEGFTCNATAYKVSITGRACAPINLSCTTPAHEEPRVLINEILADPPNGAAGDANADGTRDATDDEFVELVNPGQDAIDVGGWSLSDGVTVRFVFPIGARIPPSAAAVVFGGGDVSGLPSTDRLRFYAASGGLRLNNKGDSLTLRAADGRIMEQLTFGNEAGQDRSLVRETDGDGEAAFILHPGDVPYSPGVKTSGADF